MYVLCGSQCGGSDGFFLAGALEFDSSCVVCSLQLGLLGSVDLVNHNRAAPFAPSLGQAGGGKQTFPTPLQHLGVNTADCFFLLITL